MQINFKQFIERTFETLNPSSKFEPNWHIDLIASKLEDAWTGLNKRLIINMPPRALKSMCVSVAWPAWILAKNPAARIMVASYSQILSIKHSIDCRKILNSSWYKKLFPNTILSKDHNQKSKFITSLGGYRFATSVLGTATGEGGNFLIVDDPHNAMQASSTILRQKGIDWFEQTFISRLDDKKNGVIVIVMQRFHEEDLSGHLLKKSNAPWELVKIPLISTHDTDYNYYNQIKTYKKGEFLHKERYGFEEAQQIRFDLGDYAFQAQYQQEPITKVGVLVKKEWFCRYKIIPQNFEQITFSWDIASKPGENNDYSVCTIWGKIETKLYLIDVIRFKATYPELKKRMIEICKEHNPHNILIEDKSSGIALIQDLRKETLLPIKAVKPTKNKYDRFTAASSLIESQKVFLPESSIWLLEYEKEILNFPNTQYDDQVDSTSQFLNYIRENETKRFMIRNS